MNADATPNTYRIAMSPNIAGMKESEAYKHQFHANSMTKEEYYQKYIKPKHTRKDHGKEIAQAKAKKKRRSKR